MRENKKSNSGLEFLSNNNLLNSKLSQGHIEVIISFTIFVGFLVFVFIIINPFAKTKDISFIGNVERAIINDISAEVGKLSIVTEDTCYNLGGNYLLNNPTEVRESANKYSIYYGDFLSGNKNNEDDACSTNYELGTYSKENLPVYGKIQELANQYNSDYAGLKTRLGITKDFSFDLIDMEGNSYILDDYIAYYKFDDDPIIEDVYDAKGYATGYCNVYGSCPSLTTNAKGEEDKAYLFDGSDDFIELGTKDFGIIDEFSISMWIKPEDLSPGTTWLIGRGNKQPYEINIDSGNIQVELTTNYKTVLSLDLNTWQHIVVTYDGNKIYVYKDVYKDGDFFQDIEGGDINVDPDKYTVIGANSDGVINIVPGSYFKGSMDEVKIYNKALSENEIKNVFTNKNIPKGVNVEAKDIPIRVINDNAEINEYILKIKVW